jgi:ATP-dependent helicase HrpA
LPAHPFLYPEFKPGRDLREDVLDRIMAALFLDGRPDIRTPAAFEERLAACRHDLVLSGNEVGKTINDILSLYLDLAKKLKARPTSALQDLQEQLGLMIYAGFVCATPYPALKELPRYLKAMQYRLEKSAQDLPRDQKQFAELKPFWTNYWNRVGQGRNVLLPERDAFRWSLEEFRVSLFAQSLKTAYPISAKRLEEAWNKKIK